MRCPTAPWFGQSFAAADRLRMMLLLGVTASPTVNWRPVSTAIPMARK